ncbi:NADH-ubiquinone oxidoreductase subunit B17.2 [Paracoccidioides lutzii Pb01]|uniref:NADH dehydrogenase [ubiquinone] 1 alpha subcomplex subunit n=1 Tax=Paracoccidioides lutzii (strain ATCC MYA-826 / Pb01) TaxID=502779 RepID=C1GPL3_PARBA|nr:NADH-ubiquinone oxidoreductase subunit B17.2 [Paracoccidioides lutzii Pb01]EEH36135.2 NADH-ubiquinone oxidoreductase subunit B17.2 [Paracoccidioides lutzii Pb01]
MSTILRTVRNLWRIGFKEYGHQMQYIGLSPSPHRSCWGTYRADRNELSTGDTKAGTLIATDRYGNKYYENMDELPLRTRWVDYKEKEFDASQIDGGWHAWLAYMVDNPPTQDVLMQTGVRPWELSEHRPNMTLSRAAYRPYSTVRPKYSAWTPVAGPR